MVITIKNIPLRWFTKDEEFPFFIQYGGHDEDFPIHNHLDFLELVIVLNGHATHVVNDEVTFIKKGHVFIIHGHDAHAYLDPCSFRICNIMFKPELLDRIGPDLHSLNGYVSMFIPETSCTNKKVKQHHLSMSLNDFEYVEAFVAEMIDEYQLKQPGHKTLLTSKFIELAIYLSRFHESGGRGTKTHLVHLSTAVSYIEDHYLEQISLEDIASHSNISTRHLNRIFKSFYQTSPMAYLQRLRLERACHLLRLTQWPITQVSYQSGFNDSNYFSRQFNKVYGMSPKQFRQKESTS